MKQGDYVVFKKGSWFAGSIGKVVMYDDEHIGARVRILHSTNSNIKKNDRLVTTQYQLDVIDPKVGEILDN